MHDCPKCKTRHSDYEECNVVIGEEQSMLGTFQYVADSTSLYHSTKPHYLPHSQCPSCLDVGQDLYIIDKVHKILRCPYCKVQYKMILVRKEE